MSPARGRAAAACLAAAALWLLPGVARAACTDISFDASPFTVCEVQFGKDDLRIWLDGDDGLPLGTFGRLEQHLENDGLKLGFAMNAGMFRPDLTAAGLLILNGKQVSPIVTQAGPGNFGMLPNGVFCIAPDRYAVIESLAFAANPPDCRYATQSGPMLVIDGKLHPRFLPDATSAFIRNGVGVSADGQTAWFAISDAPVPFIDFANLFREKLGTPNALFFDGKVSRLDDPAADRRDGVFPVGPMIGTVTSAAGPAPAPAAPAPVDARPASK